jgi:predicted naringenin-chalcone synthase
MILRPATDARCRAARVDTDRVSEASGTLDDAQEWWMTLARIAAIASAVPATSLEQSEIVDEYVQEFAGAAPDVARILAKSQVRRRYVAWDPRELPEGGYPLIGERMRAWEQHSLELGRQLVPAVLAGVDRNRVGTFVMASSTGYTNPGPEVALAKEFGLRDDLRRTFVGHMGCYAAFNTIKVALDAVTARPEELALAGCVEFSSLHIREEATAEQAVVHSLFGDAGAMVLLSAAPDATGPAIVRTHTETHYDAYDAMGLRIHDDSFRMHLSPAVPMLLARVIVPFLERLLKPVHLTFADIAHWGIHPGGPKIVELLGRRLRLTEEQLHPSRHVLAEYGNCASATILLIARQLIASAEPRPGEYGVLMGFGPGLTIESMLVRF